MFVHSYGLLRLCHAEGYKNSFEDLQVNDRVIVSIRSSEMENFRSGGNEEEMLEVEQLQLYTQRPAE